MPIYFKEENLFIPKKVIEAKYDGGMNQFRIDFPKVEGDDEDNELISLAPNDDLN